MRARPQMPEQHRPESRAGKHCQEAARKATAPFTVYALPSHNDGHERQHGRQRGGLPQDELHEHDVEGGLERLDGVRQGDGDGCERQVGRNVADGVHRGGPEDGAKLLLGDDLRCKWSVWQCHSANFYGRMGRTAHAHHEGKAQPI